MVSPVENSEIEGTSGRRSENFRPLKIDSQSAGLRYFRVSTSFCRNGFLYRVLSSLNTSTPPAMALSIRPHRMASTAEVMAMLDEIHAMEIVVAGTDPGMPAASPDSLAMLWVLTSCITLHCQRVRAGCRHTRKIGR